MTKQQPQQSPSVDVIFLDMDGVMLPFGNDDNASSSTATNDDETKNLFPSQTLAALSYILREIPTAVLVLSSTWRVRPEYCSEVIQNFQQYGKQHGACERLATMDDFYDVTDIHTHSERQEEIHNWLVLNKDRIRAWIALDDEELILGKPNERFRDEFEGRVVKTESSVGLTKDDAKLAISLLNEQIEVLNGR